jgi:hypothetical protein
MYVVVYMCVWVYGCMCVCVYVVVYMCVCVYGCMCVCVYVVVYMCVCVYGCMCVCVYVVVYICVCARRVCVEGGGAVREQTGMDIGEPSRGGHGS